MIIQHAVWLYFRFALSYRDVEDKTVDLWRSVDDEGEVLDIPVQSKRNRKAALKLQRRLLKRQKYVLDAIVTDGLDSCGSALRELGLTDRHVTGHRSNNRAEVSH